MHFGSFNVVIFNTSICVLSFFWHFLRMLMFLVVVIPLVACVHFLLCSCPIYFPIAIHLPVLLLSSFPSSLPPLLIFLCCCTCVVCDQYYRCHSYSHSHSNACPYPYHCFYLYQFHYPSCAPSHLYCQRSSVYRCFFLSLLFLSCYLYCFCFSFLFFLLCLLRLFIPMFILTLLVPYSCFFVFGQEAMGKQL